MVTGIQANGTDLDSLLEPRTTTKIEDVNIDSNGGVDISNRFEKFASGSAPSTTNIQKAGADLATLFAAIGTVGETKKLDTNITSGTEFDGYKSTKRIFSGFDAGGDKKGLGSFGSIANGSYTDAGSTSRTVTAFYFNSGGQGSNNTGSIWLSISDNSPSDTDTVFSKVILDGTTFTRSSAFTSGTVGGGATRWWRWDPGFPDPFLGSNPDPFELWAE